VYRLDCTDLNEWQRLSDQAVNLAQVVLGRKPRDQHTLEPIDISDQKIVLPVYGDYYCEDCSRPFSSKCRTPRVSVLCVSTKTEKEWEGVRQSENILCFVDNSVIDSYVNAL